MSQKQYYAAVYWIIRDDSGKILLQRRANTGFNDGILQFPSGHIEWEETYFDALKREMKEEIHIDITPDNVNLSHVLHRIHPWERVYFDVFFEIKNFTGSIKNMEPSKCSELDFFEETHADITPYNVQILKMIKNGIPLSETVM